MKKQNKGNQWDRLIFFFKLRFLIDYFKILQSSTCFFLFFFSYLISVELQYLDSTAVALCKT